MHEPAATMSGFVDIPQARQGLQANLSGNKVLYGKERDQMC